jgi:anionic cell wall polymer biosynthesis LytR-Cps2A-Psr (LCP) family protein
VLNGIDALAFVRSRYYQYFDKGRWRPEGTGDLGRIERQHEFVRALASKAIHLARNPFKGARVLDKVVKTVAVDDTFSSDVMLRMGIKLRSLHPADVPSFSLPNQAVLGYRGFGDVLLPQPAQDAQVIAAWQSYGAPASQPQTPASTAPPATSNKRGAPAAPTTTTTVKPPWDPSAC